MDDKLSDDNTYNWSHVETVKSHEGREVAEMGKGRGQAICGMGRWLHLSRDLAVWMRVKTK